MNGIRRRAALYVCRTLRNAWSEFLNPVDHFEASHACRNWRVGIGHRRYRVVSIRPSILQSPSIWFSISNCCQHM